VDDGTTTQQLLSWLARSLKSRRKQPFFAFVSYQASHFPYEQGLQIPALFKPDQLNDDQRAQLTFFFYPRDLSAIMLNRYRNSLAYTDAQIARVLQFLKNGGLLQNTVVVIFGDHGELFYENGHVTHASGLYDAELRVTFTIWGAPGLRGILFCTSEFGRSSANGAVAGKDAALRRVPRICAPWPGQPRYPGCE